MVDRAAQDERRVACWDDESHHPDHRDVRDQHSLDRIGGMWEGGFLAHRSS